MWAWSVLLGICLGLGNTRCPNSPRDSTPYPRVNLWAATSQQNLPTLPKKARTDAQTAQPAQQRGPSDQSDGDCWLGWRPASPRPPPPLPHPKCAASVFSALPVSDIPRSGDVLALFIIIFFYTCSFLLLLLSSSTEKLSEGESSTRSECSEPDIKK